MTTAHTTDGGIGGLHAAYEEGGSPIDVAARFLAADPVGGGVDAFVAVDADAVEQQAAAVADRLARGGARRALEGVLVGVKDHIGVDGLPCRSGTTFLEGPRQDDVMVRRLREAGAIIAGKTRMTELGVSPVGVNLSGGTPRNPHALDRATGGSSSGSTAAVAAGLVQLAIGSDGGGSVRIPPALCGVFGFKPTFRAVPASADAILGWWSTVHFGPIARTADDLATMFAVMADRPVAPDDPGDVRFGVDWGWWGQPDVSVDGACRPVTTELHVDSVTVEGAELSRAAGFATIVSEVATGVFEHLRDHPERFAPDLRAALSSALEVRAIDYLRAQQVRTRLDAAFARVFDRVDLLLLPTVPLTAPLVDDTMRANGLLDIALVGRLVEYTMAANLCGLPAASVPVGTAPDGLPVGLQVIGPRGADDLVLSTVRRLARAGLAVRPVPATIHDAL